MTSETAERAAEAFDAHDAFAQRDEGVYESTTTPFDATVELADAADDGSEYRVTVAAPTLGAVVAGEDVATVIEDGWFETLELRLADAHTVMRGGSAETSDGPAVRREAETVVVALSFDAEDPAGAPEDAQAVVEYVEGTWMQGVIPGYEYGEPARSMLERAEGNYEERNESSDLAM